MKTLDELYKDVIASDELKKEFAEATRSKDTIAAWLKKHDCDATFEELGTFIKDKRDGEMQNEEIESVAGGKSTPEKVNNIVLSIVTFVAACAEDMLPSVGPNEKYTFTECMDKFVGPDCKDL